MKNSGVININKPEGYTSHDVVARLRRRLGIKRVGHTGTLDPMATGVLPVCYGKATRIIEYYDHDWKTYEAELELGKVSDTLDSTGEVVEERSAAGVTREDVLALEPMYRGTITQIPPRYSALKINGRPLYKYAREGQEIDIDSKKREIEIRSFAFTSIDIPTRKVSFTVTCSKGTYIRRICAEIGELLGTGAVMTKLERTRSGVFEIVDAYNLDDVLAMNDEELEKIVIDCDSTIINLRKLVLKEGSEPFYFNGRKIEPRYYSSAGSDSFENANDGDIFPDLYRLYDVHGDFLGTCRMLEDGVLKPEKVIGNRD